MLQAGKVATELADIRRTYCKSEDDFGRPCIREWGTGLCWRPDVPKGYQTQRRNGQTQEISVMSYAAFGENYNWALELAARWCRRAEIAWNIL